MNIWSLKKDINIKHLLLLLQQQFRHGGFEIVDNASDDDRAIRLQNPLVPGVQLYIFTYGQQAEYYGVHIEYPNLQETNYSDTIETYENISFDRLMNIIITELEIAIEHEPK